VDDCAPLAVGKQAVGGSTPAGLTTGCVHGRASCARDRRRPRPGRGGNGSPHASTGAPPSNPMNPLDHQPNGRLRRRTPCV
jgi:hypothetical protein